MIIVNWQVGDKVQLIDNPRFSIIPEQFRIGVIRAKIPKMGIVTRNIRVKLNISTQERKPLSKMQYYKVHSCESVTSVTLWRKIDG